MPRGPSSAKSKGGRPSPKLAAVAAPKDTGDLLGLTEKTLARLRHIEESIAKRLKKGELTAALAREATGLARAVVALGSEMRQQEKYYEKRGAELTDEETDELLIEFMVELSPARRKRYLDALMSDEEAPGLLG